MKISDKKTQLIIILELIIATGFVVGANWTNHTIYTIYQSYFADIFLPFGFYFLLHLVKENIFINRWWKKAVIVLALVSLSETLQYFGIYALARIFDPMDYIMYALGVLLAAFVDKKIFAKKLYFWEG